MADNRASLREWACQEQVFWDCETWKRCGGIMLLRASAAGDDGGAAAAVSHLQQHTFQSV
eukprot:CAMPEP_0175177662 /NCGR_PEP_ID=MMETSP0087-20121206/34517_1 /TAXON_ID=136419 /ORGANISM="Unknown Unknown, Strain D1" /LENGTH=59 /DNA_ID=CAMNT_0016469677 /DNA_START=219 /DNA_END=398 /DNA_ORIENTATION=+